MKVKYLGSDVVSIVVNSVRYQFTAQQVISFDDKEAEAVEDAIYPYPDLVITSDNDQEAAQTMDFKGNWNASTNTPVLTDGVGNAGDVYLVTVAGTVDLGSGSQDFAEGEWVVYGDGVWKKSNISASSMPDASAVNRGFVSVSAQTFAGKKDFLNGLSTLSTPSNAGDITNKLYVDTAVLAKANKDLSDLTATAVNQDLVAVADNTKDLGAIGKRWADAFIARFVDATGIPVLEDTRVLKNATGVPMLDFSGANVDAKALRIINAADPTGTQDLATKGYVDSAVGAGSGANAQLSNLSSTAVNASIIPATTNAVSLGSPSKYWLNGYIGALQTNDIVIAGTGFARTGHGLPSGSSNNFSWASVGTNSSMGFATSNNTFADASFSNHIRIETGNKTAGTGNSGNIYLQTGTSVGGTRGQVILNGSSVDASNTQIKNVATPTDTNDVATKGYVDSASGGASTDLSNLTTTSINQDLIPSADQTRTLGASNKWWNNIYAVSGRFYDGYFGGISPYVKIAAGGVTVSPSGANLLGVVNYLAQSGAALGLLTANQSSGGYASKAIYVETGNQSQNGLASGDIRLRTGTVTTGTRGIVSLIAAYVDVNSTQIKNVATPTASTDAATKGYVDSAAGVKVTSSEFSLPADNSSADWAHGLGSVPSRYRVALRCISAQYGFVAGDEIDITSNLDGDGGRGTTSKANATNVSVNSNAWSAYYVKRYDAASTIALTPANWRIVFTAWS